MHSGEVSLRQTSYMSLASHGLLLAVCIVKLVWHFNVVRAVKFFSKGHFGTVACCWDYFLKFSLMNHQAFRVHTSGFLDLNTDLNAEGQSSSDESDNADNELI